MGNWDQAQDEAQFTYYLCYMIETGLKYHEIYMSRAWTMCWRLNPSSFDQPSLSMPML